MSSLISFNLDQSKILLSGNGLRPEIVILYITLLQLMVVDCIGFNATLIAKIISWRSVTHMFSGSLTPVLTQLFFP